MPIRGVGTDAVEIERFRELLRRRPRITERLFTSRERHDAESRGDPAQSLAARFAAKEATLKALGVGLGAVRLRDIEVVRSETGAPSLRLHAAAVSLARQRGAHALHVTLTHTKTMAIATVVCEDGGVV